MLALFSSPQHPTCSFPIQATRLIHSPKTQPFWASGPSCISSSHPAHTQQPSHSLLCSTAVGYKFEVLKNHIITIIILFSENKTQKITIPPDTMTHFTITVSVKITASLQYFYFVLLYTFTEKSLCFLLHLFI